MIDNSIGNGSQDATLAPEQRDRLAGILDDYVRALERGEAPAIEDLVALHPELGEDLREYLDGVRMIQQALAESPALRDLPESDATNARDPDATGVPGPDTSLAPPPIKRIGDFRLEREIGRGGMGIVYEARQESLNRQVALKVLPFAAVLDQRQIARFRTEAQAAAQLHHTNIVPVFAVGQERGVHFYAMQYIEGQSLLQAVEEMRCSSAAPTLAPTANKQATKDATTVDVRVSGPLSTVGSIRDTSYFRAVARLGIQAAEALQHAHDYGILHRDIKPSNLLIDRQGKLWITDFGLARIQNDLSMTVTGDVVGTLRYMSPEQAQGRGDMVDGRTDVYGLGATLYELVTLCQAYPGDDRRQLIEQIEQADPVRPRRLNASIPVDLETIIVRAMEKSRDDRYATARDLADDLRRYLDGLPTVARRPTALDYASKWARRHRSLVAIGSAAMSALCVIACVAVLLIAREQSRTAAALHDSTINSKQAQSVLTYLTSDIADGLDEVPGAERLREKLLVDTLGYYRHFAKINDDPALAFDVAVAHLKAGGAADKLGAVQDALAEYQTAADLGWDHLSRATGDDHQWRSVVTMALTSSGELLRQQGALKAAEPRLTKAVELSRTAYESSKDNSDAAARAAEALSALALLREATGDQRAAADLLADAIRILEHAVAEAPEDIKHRRNLAVAYNNLSFVLRDAKPAASQAAIVKAADSLRAIVALDADDLRARGDLAMAMNNLGAIYGRQENWDAAVTQYGHAVTELHDLVRRAPTAAALRRELAITECNLATAYSRLQKEDESDSHFATARAVMQSLIRDFPDQDAYRSGMAALANNRGVALRHSGREEDADAEFTDAVERQRELVKANADNQQFKQLLAVYERNLAETAGRPDAVAPLAADGSREHKDGAL